MANALYILKLVLTARRPSHVADMRAVSMPFWLHKGYDALTFFGSIITNSEAEAHRYNNFEPTLLNAQPQPGPTKSWYHPVKFHETIHLRQAQSTRNSWLLFYWKYFVFWLQARRANRVLPNAGYELNPFEMEAYANMYNPHYLDRFPDGRAVGWQEYAKMSLAQRFWARRKYAGRA
jgi:hypothetical protein